MRTIVDLPEEQVRGLDLWCQRERISRAEAVRRAVRDALSTRNSSPRADAFGAWAAKKINSREYVESLRAEWDK
ncbi:MAG: ribbon-helix-helix protein, CopG family [Verrucomicrobia bacterium]|nr:ribbon-helix-helix protein, CopG family [Verrucomicrobiota bacterium]